MNTLNVKAFGGLLFLLLVMAALLFAPAGALNHGRAWALLAVFGGSGLAGTLYLMKYDRKLLERRMRAGPAAEKELAQQIIQCIMSIGFMALLVVPGFDYRLHWSAMPDWMAALGDALVVLGFVIISFVYRENSFASATIELAPGHKLISTGPYALVRHPMYFGALFMFIGIPVALGSWWGLLVAIVMTPALIWRLFDEERFLASHLAGYSEYQTKVKFRLIPFVW
jgi:protein-S-isoprenylcysteine O-methyltransferase Ste14